MTTSEQQQRIFKARVALALYGLLGRMPESREINRAFLLICIMGKAGHGLHSKV